MWLGRLRQSEIGWQLFSSRKMPSWGGELRLAEEQFFFGFDRWGDLGLVLHDWGVTCIDKVDMLCLCG